MKPRIRFGGAGVSEPVNPNGAQHYLWLSVPAGPSDRRGVHWRIVRITRTDYRISTPSGSAAVPPAWEIARLYKDRWPDG